MGVSVTEMEPPVGEKLRVWVAGCVVPIGEKLSDTEGDEEGDPEEDWACVARDPQPKNRMSLNRGGTRPIAIV